MAQAFDLAGAKNIVGAPSFAHFAKGGNLERMRDLVAEPQKLCRQHRYPPLQKTQGRGTLTMTFTLDGAHRHHQKGGPPPVTFSILSPEPSYALASVDTQQTGWARYRLGPGHPQRRRTDVTLTRFRRNVAWRMGIGPDREAETLSSGTGASAIEPCNAVSPKFESGGRDELIYP